MEKCKCGLQWELTRHDVEVSELSWPYPLLV
jgi:hypothetical protein